MKSYLNELYDNELMYLELLSECKDAELENVLEKKLYETQRLINHVKLFKEKEDERLQSELKIRENHKELEEEEKFYSYIGWIALIFFPITFPFYLYKVLYKEFD
jgi:hypothetical protein